VPPEERHAAYLGQIATLGRRTAELHRAFATAVDDPNFKPEPIKAADVAAWAGGAKKLAQAAIAQLVKAQAGMPESLRGPIDTLLERRDECLAAIDQLGKGSIKASKTRIHGDYHLGQVLVAKNDFYIIDFEGEPTRTLQERRLKSSPFKDVAGMLRSFEYAEWAALFAIAEHEADSVAKLLPFAEAWRKCTQATFLSSYFEAIGDSPSCPKDRAEADRLLKLFTLEKALYEICYEATNRPSWLRIPIAGLQTVLDSLKERKEPAGAAA
jgi:maltose alpha-D-glucosyltransferase/alpha-amylase